MLSKVLKKKRVPSAVSAVRSEDAVFGKHHCFRKRLWIHWKRRAVRLCLKADGFGKRIRSDGFNREISYAGFRGGSRL